jgi:TRAP-type C4-dicarboxylate transport system permease small subunit
MKTQLVVLTSWNDRIVGTIAVGIFAIIICANGVEILQRGLFNRSFQWLYECNLLASAWIYFLGISLVYYRGKDITLDFILLVLHGRVRRCYLIGINIVAIITFLIVGFYGARLMLLQLPFRTSGVGIPNALFTCPLVISMIAITLILIRQSLEIWAGETIHSGHAPPDAAA